MITDEERAEMEKQNDAKVAYLYTFCECTDSKGIDIWKTVEDNICKMYGNGVKCPVAAFANRYREPKVRDCIFVHDDYSETLIKDAFGLVKDFEEENPDWKEGKLGVTEEPDHDNTYQNWAPGGGVD